MMKEKTIRPELFEVKHEYGCTYVVAYDIIHALQAISWHSKAENLEIKQLTGGNKNIISTLYVAKECLPQGLVNKTVDDNESKT